eukprot:g29812.t1
MMPLWKPKGSLAFSTLLLEWNCGRSECFSFDGKQAPRQLVVDVFEKVGSAQVSVSDLASCSNGSLVQLQGRDGNIVLDMQAKVHSHEITKPRLSRHQAALDAQAYLEAHSVPHVLQGMVHELLSSRPADPYSFMMGYIKAGDADDSGFLQEPQEEDDFDVLPDWSRHHNVLASVLLARPELYEDLKDVRTASGSSLAQCIKPGIDNRGAEWSQDESCYETFAPLFRAVMSRWQEIVSEDVELSRPAEEEAKGFSFSSSGGFSEGASSAS